MFSQLPFMLYLIIKTHFLLGDGPFTVLKDKTDKLNFIKINNFCSIEDTVKTMKSLFIPRRKCLQITYFKKMYVLNI